jgi:hypothetical protein
LGQYRRVPIQLVGRATLLKAKQASGRPQDLLDVERLQQRQDEDG